MNNLVINRLKAAVALLALLGLTACGGGSGTDESVATNAPSCTSPQIQNQAGVCIDPTPDTNVGRCLTTYSNAPKARALLLCHTPTSVCAQKAHARGIRAAGS